MWLHFGCLVEQDDVAELYLLYDKVLYVFFCYLIARQSLSVAKLVLHPQSVHHGDYAVEPCEAILPVAWLHGRDGADGLGYGGRFADAACLYDDIVKLLHGSYLAELLHEVHLQSAADASVLQGYEALVLLSHHTTLLYECGVDIHLSYVVDDDGKFYTLFIAEYAIEQCGLSAAEVSCQQQHR